MTEKFIIGVIGAPFGVKGFVKVRSFSGEIDHLLSLKEIKINKDGQEKLLKIDESSPSAPGVIIHFKGFDSPEAAKTLNGAQLIASRDQAAPLNDGEFYIEDLKGLQVVSDKNELVGHVLDIIEGGGGELAEIKLINNGEKHLVPFRKEFFSEIIPEKGILVIHDLATSLLYENNKFSKDIS